MHIMDIVGIEKSPWYERKIYFGTECWDDVIDFMNNSIGILPLCVISQFLYPISEQQFIDLLNIESENPRHLITNRECEFRKNEKNNQDDPFWKREDVFKDVGFWGLCGYGYPSLNLIKSKTVEDAPFVNYEDWLNWAHINIDLMPENRNYNLLPPIFLKQSPNIHCHDNKQESRIAELEAELAEAKAQAAAPQEIVTVDAALWENSCKAACTVLVEIMGNGETGITRDNFLERMRAIIPGKRTHTKADKIAWATLPDRYKNGPGCPKK